jgi:cytochrome c peroxidase
MDFWFRYLEPISYKKINGPLPVEWETEVFEKFEKPYKREGAGLTLALLYLDESSIKKDHLIELIQASLNATQTFYADSITNELKTYHHFFLCNRLFLLNLAAIYTTGFECPDTAQIIPELRLMLSNVGAIYQSFNESFPNTPLPLDYISLYKNAVAFANTQSNNYSQFDHFTFIKDYINPLFAFNQTLINQYHVVTKSYVDYSLSKKANSIFNKKLYTGQNPKGVFLRVNDNEALAEIEQVGKLLFYDPILSGNNSRSCASCHNPTTYFTDTATSTSLQYNKHDFLPRNSPSLINAEYNHLLMMDGKHLSLQQQTKAVISNPIEMSGDEKQILQKVLNCKEYNKTLQKLLKHTPQETEVTIDHIASAITVYYSKFSNAYSPFDKAMNENKSLSSSAKNGFNLFMSKAQCATCHFVPQFNGVKPPFVSSEFEVLGVPADTAYTKLSSDKGRYDVNPADETLNAFRTGSIRNAEHTSPYMHNGVFKTLSEVIDFYNAGGGAGRGLAVNNQTLSSDSLHLSPEEKNDLIHFIKSLNEDIQFENPPETLPISKNKTLNTRIVGGIY